MWNQYKFILVEANCHPCADVPYDPVAADEPLLSLATGLGTETAKEGGNKNWHQNIYFKDMCLAFFFEMLPIII